MTSDLPIHIVIPDTQAKPNVPMDHLHWIGQYIVDKFAGKDNIRIVHLGDHADMPSLSSYDRGKRVMEGRRVLLDIEAANEAWDVLNAPMSEYNVRQRMTKHAQWLPERHILDGNHEYRIVRAANDSPELDGFLTLDALNYADYGWQRHAFLTPVDIDGVVYSHYFANPMTGKPYAGVALNRLRILGHSFTMGHQQTLDYAMRYVRDTAQHGLVAGACYLHDEEYKGPQGNNHWRGIIVKHQVQNGSYDPMFVSLDYLCRRYEGVPLAEFRQGL